MERFTKNYGLTLETNYPYVATRGICRLWNFGRWQFTKNVNQTLPYQLNGDEAMLKNLVKNNGPVVVAINATKYFQFYKTGIFVDTTCDGSSLNHAVTVVG